MLIMLYGCLENTVLLNAQVTFSGKHVVVHTKNNPEQWIQWTPSFFKARKDAVPSAEMLFPTLPCVLPPHLPGAAAHILKEAFHKPQSRLDPLFITLTVNQHSGGRLGEKAEDLTIQCVNFQFIPLWCVHPLGPSTGRGKAVTSPLRMEEDPRAALSQLFCFHLHLLYSQSSWCLHFS